MNENEQLLAEALCTAITEANFLADLAADVDSDTEYASIDLLDRLEAGLRSGDIKLEVSDHLFYNGRLCWPRPEDMSA